MTPKVKVLPAKLKWNTAIPSAKDSNRRVAGYARVSTDHDDQFTSYQAQIDYYTNYIKGRSDWQFVEVYTDEGITGTSVKHREGFKRMISDALDGKIDLIVTKSVSRFARNTVDSLTTIRKLKDSGVEVYFEKENIWTFDGKGELLLTIMSSLAQEESRSISENCTWGQRKRFADGKVSLAYSQFLGYDRGPDGNLVINHEQAGIIRKIFFMFLNGNSYGSIATMLTREGVRTPGGKAKWRATTIRSILTNEKYKGDALLQKTFTVDFLSKKHKVNEGEIPQYYVEGNHEAIIPPETFDMVQREIEKRAGKKRHRAYEFSGRVKCGECGALYGSKVWHSNSKYRKVIWQCNGKYAGGAHCHTPHVTDEDIRQAFSSAFEKFLSVKDEVLANCRDVIEVMCDTTELESERNALDDECRVLSEMVQKMIAENAMKAIDQDGYRNRYDSIAKKYEKKKAKLDAVTEEIRRRRNRRADMEAFARDFENTDAFSQNSWNTLVEYATVYSIRDIRFTFKNGQEIKS